MIITDLTLASEETIGIGFEGFAKVQVHVKHSIDSIWVKLVDSEGNQKWFSYAQTPTGAKWLDMSVPGDTP